LLYGLEKGWCYNTTVVQDSEARDDDGDDGRCSI